MKTTRSILLVVIAILLTACYGEDTFQNFPNEHFVAYAIPEADSTATFTNGKGDTLTFKIVDNVYSYDKGTDCTHSWYEDVQVHNHLTGDTLILDYQVSMRNRREFGAGYYVWSDDIEQSNGNNVPIEQYYAALKIDSDLPLIDQLPDTIHLILSDSISSDTPTPSRGTIIRGRGLTEFTLHGIVWKR